MTHLTLHVGPIGYNRKRLVIACLDGLEHQDRFDTDVSFQRQKFIQAVNGKFGVAPDDDEIIRLADEEDDRAEAVKEWTAPEPLPTELSPVLPFDEWLLPESVAPFVTDVADRMQCPLEFPAVGIMVAIAGVVGRKIGVRPKKQDDWTVVPNLWGMIIGRPGVMKTPALDEPLKFLKRLEIEAKKQFDDDGKQFAVAEILGEARKKNLKRVLEQAVKSGKDCPEDIAAQMLEEDSKQPTRRRFTCNDTTVEKLGEILNENCNGVTIVRDEIYAFLKTLDKEGHEAARGFYLEAWNGTGRYTYDRVGRGTIDIDAACVSMVGSIQPGRIGEYVRSAVKGGSGDDGLIQRFQLAVWPDHVKKWQNVDRWPDTDAKNRVWATVQMLNNLDPATVGAVADEDGDTPYLRFDDDAQQRFDEWRAGLERRIRSDEMAPALESHLAKYRSLIPTLALLIHLADGGSGPIPAEPLSKAIRWGEVLESHARRIYGLAVRPDISAAHALAKKIADGSLADNFTLRDVYRPCWAGLANKEEAQIGVDLLIELNWLRAEQLPTVGRPTITYLINPVFFKKAPSDELTKLTKPLCSTPFVSSVSATPGHISENTPSADTPF